jgi:hypothetical protein
MPRPGRARRPPGARCLRVLVIAIVVATGVSPCGALTLAPLTLAELTDLAPIIVRARCSERQSSSGVGGRVDSVARFEVIESLKGTPGVHLDVRQLGGRSGEVEVVVPGAPLSGVGDEALLFLAPGGSGMLEVVGVAQGYLPVAAMPGGEALVRVSSHLAPEFADRAMQPLSRVIATVRSLAREAR